MTSRAPYTLDPSGAVSICCDGPEVMAYSGANDQAIWKQFTQGILIGARVSGAEVATVDADGHVIWWRKLDGAKLRDVRLDVLATAVEVNPVDHTLAVVCQTGVVLVTPKGDFNLIERDGAVAAVFGGGQLAIGFGNGVVEILELGSGAENGVVEVHAAITDMAWSALGYFVVAAGTALHLINQQDVPPPPPPPDVDPKTYKPPPAQKRWGLESQIAIGPVHFVECATHGILVLATSSETEAVVVELNTKTIVGQITASREISGLGFGNANWAGVGLEDMACSRIDLVTGKVARVTGGLGRMPSAYNITANLNAPQIRGALAKASAGGQDIAARVDHKPMLPEIPGAEGAGPALYIGIGCLALFLLCGGCSCLGTVVSLAL